jgi:hypothetical protein
MLEYEPAKPHYQPTPEDQTWLFCRLSYYGSQLLLFVLIGFWIGPNLRLFHSPFNPTPADYVQYARQYVPIIAAIKAYQRDFGHLPSDGGLPQAYLPASFLEVPGEISGTTSITFIVGMQGVLEYEFNPAKEGWIIHSPRYDGPLSAPIVPAAPKPLTVPASSPTTSISNGG